MQTIISGPACNLNYIDYRIMCRKNVFCGSMSLKRFKWNAKVPFCSAFHPSETIFGKFAHAMTCFWSNLVITSFIMTRYHMWCDSYKCGVFFTLWNHKTHGNFIIFARKRVMKRSVCFAFLPTYDDPMFNWRFFLLLFYCDWNTFSRVGPWGPILLKVFQSTC